MVDTPAPRPQDESGAGATSLVSTLRLAFVSLRVLMFVLVVAYLFSGVFIVKQNEQAFVLRFGEVKRDNSGPVIYGPGKLHFAFPRPIDTVVRIPTGDNRVVQTAHFWYKEQNFAGTSPGEQQQQGHGEGISIGTDGYLLTGDYNIMHTKWSLTFRITNAYNWYAQYDAPEAAIERALQKAVLHNVAKVSVDYALYTGVEALQRRVKQDAISLIGNLNAGVTVDEVYYDDSIPLRDVWRDFTEVLSAEMRKSQKVNEAERYHEEVVQRAEGERQNRIAEAESYRTRLVASTQADADYLTKIKPLYDQAPKTMLLALYTQAIGNVLESAKGRIYVVRKDQEIWYRLGPKAPDYNSPAPPGPPN